MKILVINSGSSSLKYTLFDMTDEQVLFSGSFDRIGLSHSTHSYKDRKGEETIRETEIRDHGQALDEMLAALTAGPVTSLEELGAVAHRIGHGGKYHEAIVVNPDVMAEIRRMTPMIPLHHPAMIKEIEECGVRMPHAVHVAVFDTWFHGSIPDEAAIYGLPYRYFEKGYRRSGFHGNSHAYVAAKAAEFLGKPISELRIITCHLGNGASLCAVDRGKSIDTTLGMTAVEGLIMGTRSGDVDPGLLMVIMDEESLSPEQMRDLLFKESGLLGISGLSRDMREVEAAAAKGNRRAALALDAFCYKAKRFVGSMLMALGGCDALVFTGGIGSNSPTVRRKMLEGAEALGFVVDEAKNQGLHASQGDGAADISTIDAKVRILVIETFEELMMARQCKEVVERDRR